MASPMNFSVPGDLGVSYASRISWHTHGSTKPHRYACTPPVKTTAVGDETLKISGNNYLYDLSEGRGKIDSLLFGESAPSAEGWIS